MFFLNRLLVRRSPAECCEDNPNQRSSVVLVTGPWLICMLECVEISNDLEKYLGLWSILAQETTRILLFVVVVLMFSVGTPEFSV
jgi:hypothetical protein